MQNFDPISERSAPPVTILGIPFDNVSQKEVLNLAQRMIESGRPHYIATANVDFVAQAQRDIELRQILFDAHVVVCDGMPLVWASKALGNPLRERVAGSDLTPELLRLADREGYRIYILGGREDVAEKAIENIRRDYPNAVVAGHCSPPKAELLEMDHEAILTQIHEARPDILFVAFGCPKQEKWLSMHWRRANAPIGIGVGATIDFLSGTVKRAPKWMRQFGLEWAFRLLQEPKRLYKRYVEDFAVFLPAVTRQIRWFRRGKKARTNEELKLEFDHIEGFLRITLPKCLDIDWIRQCAEDALGRARASSGVLLDASKLKFVDSSGIGFLARIAKDARSRNFDLTLIAPTPETLKALRRMRMLEFFPHAPGEREAAQLLKQRIQERSPSGLDQPRAHEPFAIRGELTAANADTMWPAFEKILRASAENGRFLELDLSHLRFIDSSGLGALIRLKKSATKQGVHLSIHGASESVLNVFDITGTRKFLLETT